MSDCSILASGCDGWSSAWCIIEVTKKSKIVFEGSLRVSFDNFTRIQSSLMSLFFLRVNVLTCNAEVDTGSIEQHLLFQTARLVFFFQLWHLPPIPTVLVPTLLLFFVVFCQYQLISARSVHLLELLCYPEPERQIACGSFELTLEYLHERASAQWSALLFPRRNLFVKKMNIFSFCVGLVAPENV
ncbi:hypothetical protein KCU99_g102, partial [Aureobasidium melanogenum]